MESLIQECHYCNGSGYVDFNHDYDAKRQALESINEMIYVFQKKMKMYDRMIPDLRRCYFEELADKYEDKIDTYARAIARLQNYKKKFI